MDYGNEFPRAVAGGEMCSTLDVTIVLFDPSEGVDGVAYVCFGGGGEGVEEVAVMIFF